jgi:hypothetical protein
MLAIFLTNSVPVQRPTLVTVAGSSETESRPEQTSVTYVLGNEEHLCFLGFEVSWKSVPSDP